MGPSEDEGSMTMEAITIEARREGYSTSQVVDGTLTIAELMDCLQEMADAYGEDAPVVISNDHGYTYGAISWSDINAE